MDKQKTGEMVRQARLDKGYTQTQLGDLLGVSNKAVSRWENGESFPDIGIIENLSNVLGLRIQDIVVGKRGNDDVNAIVEVVRIAKLQQKDSRKRCLLRALQVVLLVAFLSGAYFSFGGYGLPWQYLQVYYYVLAMVFATVLWLCACQGECSASGKHDKWQMAISLSSLVYIILLMWCTIKFSGQGRTLFNVQEKNAGVLLNSQLVLVFLCNMIMLVVSFFKGRREGFRIYLKASVAIMVMHLTIVFGGLLHCLMTVQECFHLFAVSTIIHLLEFGIALIIARFLLKEKHQPDFA